MGPTPEGTFPEEVAERLRGIGAWMTANGDSVYGTTYGPLQRTAAFRSTRKAGATYLHIVDWPKGKLEIPGFPLPAGAVTLATKSAVKFGQAGSQLTLDLPEVPPAPGITVVEIRGKD